MSAYKELVVDVPVKNIKLHPDDRCNKTYVLYKLDTSNRTENIRLSKKLKKGSKHLVAIGHLIPGTNRKKMHPTDNYKILFQKDWEELTGETVGPYEMKIGLYCAMQAINSQSGIVEMLEKAFGQKDADALMDFAMYTMLTHSNEIKSMKARMDYELSFSKKIWSKSYYSALFQSMEEEQRKEFLREWIGYCKKQGAGKVWICIDGSNVDCEMKEGELNEEGHNKSGKNKKMIAFSYVVATDGMPITYQVYKGSLVDAKALRSLIEFLESCGLHVMGVILDRGYCDNKTIELLDEEKIDYIIMCKGNSTGYKQMVRDYGEKIKFDPDCWLWSSDDLFAMQDQVKVFTASQSENYLTLFFNFVNAAGELKHLLGKLSHEIYVLKQGLRAGKTVEVNPSCQKYIELKEGEDGKQKILINSPALGKKMKDYGLYGIISSLPLEPDEIHLLYQARSVSEVQFRIIKTELGASQVRSRLTASLRSKFFLAFLGSVLRWEITRAIREDLRTPNTNKMIEDLDSLSAVRDKDAYGYTHTASGKIKKFFQFFGQDEEILDEAARMENDRINGRYERPRRRKPGPRKGAHYTKPDSAKKKPHKKPGPKKGSKRGLVNKDGSPRKKTGVKPGTKRGKYNKDGSLRQKPGPKPKHENTTAISGA